MSESLVVRTMELVEVLDLISDLEAEGHAVPDDVIARLDNALTNQAEKIDACAAYVGRAESELDWLDKEIKTMQAKKARVERGIDRMKDLAKFVMTKEGVRELVGLRGHKFSLRDSFSCLVVDEKIVPAAFTKIKTEMTVNKAEALKALKAGEKIPGMELQKNTSVVVK